MRDFLLHVAIAPFVFYRPRWTASIHDKWTRNLAANRPDLKPKQIVRTRSLMETNFPAAMVLGYKSLVDTLTLPDPDDGHVLAVAIEGKANIIVTANLQDFPALYLSGFGIEPLFPDVFTVRLYEAFPADFVTMVQRHRSRLNNPAKSAEEYIATLRQNCLFDMAARLTRHLNEI